MSIRRNFDLADSNKNGKIDFEEFKFLLIEKLRFNFATDLLLTNKSNKKNSNKNEEEIRKLFNEFDKDKSEDIDYNEFVQSLLGELPLERETRLKQVFYILDKNNSGSISQDELKDGYFYKRHPDVLLGKKSAEEIYGEFIDNMEYHFNLINGGDPNREMNFEEFIDFYRNISFVYEKDNDFLDYLKAVWNLDA